MYTTALIVFRESLEAALLTGILLAATRSLTGSRRWIGAGVAVGAVAALLLALLAGRIAAAADGMGQDLLNVAVLSVAWAMLAWHSIWVAAHGREMSDAARRVAGEVSSGGRAPLALALAVALTVLREGAETVLFVAGSAASSTLGELVLASVLGLAGGVAAGAVVHAGLARIPLHRVFAVTNALILLITAAVAAQLARTMGQLGWLDVFEFSSEPLWDSSAWLPTTSPLGSLLHALAGYDAQPGAAQLGFYLASLLLVSLAARHLKRQATRQQAARKPKPVPTSSGAALAKTASGAATG
jgi:high-affinity iron transporter